MNDDHPTAITDHPFLPVNGHPDDNECTYRADGTDYTYCGEPKETHGCVTLFVCEECGSEYNPDEEGSDGMCEDCHDAQFESYGADDVI